MWLALTVAMLVCLVPCKSADSSYVLRYDLPVGKSFTYRVTTDQFILAKTGIRLHTLLYLDVMGRDENSNMECRLRMKSDTSLNEDDKLAYRPIGELRFGGHRLYSEAGFLQLLLDESGNLVDNKSSMDDANRTPATSTQFERITDASLNTATNTSGPYTLQLLMPSIPEGVTIVRSQVYVDTITFASRSVHLPTSYGPAGVAQREVLYDTVIRYSMLDSVVTAGKVRSGHMTIRSERRNALGGSYESTATVVRDMRSGMIQSIKEKCYRRERNGTKQVTYYANAVLIETNSITSLGNSGDFR